MMAIYIYRTQWEQRERTKLDWEKKETAQEFPESGNS